MADYEKRMAHPDMFDYVRSEEYVRENLPARYSRLVKEFEACARRRSRRGCSRIFESEIEKAYAELRRWSDVVMKLD